MSKNKKFNNKERFFQNISENLKEFAEYKLQKKYYIVWILSDFKKWEEEVSAEKYLQAIYEKKENNSNPLCVPYYTTRKFFAKTKDMDDYIEVPRKVFHLINEWQTTDLYHYFYINKRYRNRYMDEYIDEIPVEETNPEIDFIKNEELDKVMDFIEKDLTKSQKFIFEKLFFEDKSQAEIAKELGIARQSVYRDLLYIRKKLKKLKKF